MLRSSTAASFRSSASSVRFAAPAPTAATGGPVVGRTGYGTNGTNGTGPGGLALSKNPSSFNGPQPQATTTTTTSTTTNPTFSFNPPQPHTNNASTTTNPTFSFNPPQPHTNNGRNTTTTAAATAPMGPFATAASSATTNATSQASVAPANLFAAHVPAPSHTSPAAHLGPSTTAAAAAIPGGLSNTFSQAGAAGTAGPSKVTGPFATFGQSASAASSGQPPFPFPAANPTFNGFSQFAQQTPQTSAPAPQPGGQGGMFAQQRAQPANTRTPVQMQQNQNPFAAAAQPRPPFQSATPAPAPAPVVQQNPFAVQQNQNPFTKPLLQPKAQPQPQPQPQTQPKFQFQPKAQPQPQPQTQPQFQFQSQAQPQPQFQFQPQQQPQPQPQFKFKTQPQPQAQPHPVQPNLIFRPPVTPTQTPAAVRAGQAVQTDDGKVETLAQLAPGMDRACLRDLLQSFNNNLARAAEKVADLIPKNEATSQAQVQATDAQNSRESQPKDLARWRDLSEIYSASASAALSRSGRMPCRYIKPRHTRPQVPVSSPSWAAPRSSRVTCNRLQISDACKPQACKPQACKPQACKPQVDQEKVKSSKWVSVGGDDGNDETEPNLEVQEILESKAAPVLSKSGYFTVPPLRDLRTMSEERLSQVQGFEVHREGFGSIVWEESVDLRHVNLDEIVQIDRNYVSVYEARPDSSSASNSGAPAVGTGLNCPAVVTLVNVKPKQQRAIGEPTQEEIEKFTRKIEKATRRCGAKLLGYSAPKGEWRMWVPNWTGRY